MRLTKRAIRLTKKMLKMKNQNRRLVLLKH